MEDINWLINTTGEFNSYYHFSTKEEALNWIKKQYPKLQKTYSPIDYSLVPIKDKFKIGDRCYVIGDGNEEYIIEEQIEYTPTKFAYRLNSGFLETIHKCYKTDFYD